MAIINKNQVAPSYRTEQSWKSLKEYFLEIKTQEFINYHAHRAHVKVHKVLASNYSFLIHGQHLPWLVTIEGYLGCGPFSTIQTTEMNIRPGPPVPTPIPPAPPAANSFFFTRRQVTVSVASRFHKNVCFPHHILDMILDYATLGNAAMERELWTVETGYLTTVVFLRLRVS